MFNIGAFGGAWREGRTGQYVVTGPPPCISLALVRSAPRPEMLRLRRSGASVTVELHLPTNLPGAVLRWSRRIFAGPPIKWRTIDRLHWRSPR